MVQSDDALDSSSDDSTEGNWEDDWFNESDV